MFNLTLLLRSSGVMGLVGLAVVHGADRVQVDIDPVFAKHGVVAMGYNNAQFKATAASLFGTENVSAADPVLQYSVLLRNGNPSRIATVVLRYPRVNASGKTVGFIEIFNFLDSTANAASGEGIILSPDANVNDSMNHLKSPRKYPLTPQSAVAQSRGWINAHFNSPEFTKVTVSLDSVVLMDGTVIGPDRFGIIGLQKAQSATHQEFLARFQDPKTTDKDINDWLLTFSAPVPSDSEPGDSLPAQITLYRRSLAKAMLSALRQPKTGGKAGLVEYAKGLIERTNPNPESLRKVN